MKVSVGVFWLCNFDIVWDKEEYETAIETNSIIDYSKEHKDVWQKLASTQYGGKYSRYPYDFFYRGRIAFDCATQSYSIELNCLSENFSNSTKQKLMRLFEIDKIEQACNNYIIIYR